MPELLERAQAAVSDDGRLVPGPMASWEVFPFEVEGLRGSNVEVWADMLTATPADELDARAARVREALA